MATDKTVNELVINKLTQAQYDAIPEAERSDTELYFITDADKSNKIKWTNTHDIISNGDLWSGYPQFKVTPLPDGNYEFYFCIDRYSQGVRYPAVWKASFNVRTNDQREVLGFLSPVLQGDFNFVYNTFDTSEKGIEYHYIPDDDLDLLYPDSSFMYATDFVPCTGIIKCTDIVNVDTNQAYPIALTVSDTGYVTSNTTYLGNLWSGAIISSPMIPSDTDMQTYTIDNNGLCVYGIGKNLESFNPYGYGCLGGVITIKSTANLGEFEAEIYVNEVGVVYKVIKASGILQNAELGTSSTQQANTWLKPNFEGDQSYKCVFWYSRFGSNTNNPFYWFTPDMNDIYVPYTKLNVGSKITTLNYNKIIQYTDESTDNYINGYFYKAVGDITNVPENVALIKNPESDFEISLADDKDIVSILSSIVGWPIESIITNLKQSQFKYFYGAGNPYVWWNWFGDIYDQKLLSCFNVIPELEAPEGYPSSVEFTLQYTPASQGIENGRWEQVNVQPVPEVGGDYLPLSGGTLTGRLYLGEEQVGLFGENLGTLSLYKYNLLTKSYYKVMEFSVNGINPSAGKQSLGNNLQLYENVYTKSINNGADIIVPSKAGTLATLEDIPDTSTLATKDELNSKIPAHPTDDGMYVLSCSVVDGVATYTWESMA